MNRIAWATCASVLALAAVPAASQDLPQPPKDAANSSANGGDIIVTATRSATLLSKTPIAMTAVAGDQLVQEGVANPTQLAEKVPNVSIVRNNGLQITIRGVTSTDGTEKGDPSAAFLVNGVYVARPQAQEVSFFDLERVEVLRGPQGTLYGRNTTAGLINLISARPKFDLGAQVDASYESYNHYNVTAVVNAPVVTDVLAVRLAGNFDRYDSYVKNTSGDGFSLDPYKDNKSARLSVLFKPTSDISLLLVGDYSKLKGTRIGSVPTTNFFTGAAPLIDVNATQPAQAIYNTRGASSDQLRSSNTPQLWSPYVDNTDKGIMGELNIGMGPFTLTYLGSYRESERHEHATGLGGLNRSTFDGNYWQTSHEVRLAYDHGSLKVQAGGYYFKEESGIYFFLLNPQDLGLPPFATRFGFPQDPTIASNKSAFGQASYELLPKLRLTAGVRYSSDDKSRVGATVFDTDPALGIPGNRVTLQINNASRSFSKTTWRGGIDYDSPIGLFYASVATGYKAGGFNDGCLAGPGALPQCVYSVKELYYEPETLTAYEAGVKLHTADNSLRVTASVFHYDYKGLQLSQVGNFGGCGLCQLTTNAAKAKIDGVELEAYLRPTSALQVEMGFNWLDARYAQFNPGRVGPNGPVSLDFDGHALNRSPRVSGRVGATYTIDLGSAGSLVANAMLNYSSKYYLTDLASLIDYIQPAFTKTDLSITYKAANDKFYIGAYVLNLENNVVLTTATFGSFNKPNTPIFGRDGTVNFQDPRRFGVRAGIKF